MRKRITEFSPTTQLSTGNVKGRNSKRSDHKSILAQIISTKLEDGYSWAIRLVCTTTASEETLQASTIFSIGPKLGWCSVRAAVGKRERCQESSTIVTALTGFVNVVLASRCPVTVSPPFFGGRLFALTKKSGDIRSIAVRMTLRQLVSKCANFSACHGFMFFSCLFHALTLFFTRIVFVYHCYHVVIGCGLSTIIKAIYDLICFGLISYFNPQQLGVVLQAGVKRRSTQLADIQPVNDQQGNFSEVELCKRLQ